MQQSHLILKIFFAVNFRENIGYMKGSNNLKGMQEKMIVAVVGIRPDFWYVFGRFNIAGPVREFTIIAPIPMNPNDPVIKRPNYMDSASGSSFSLKNYLPLCSLILIPESASIRLIRPYSTPLYDFEFTAIFK